MLVWPAGVPFCPRRPDGAEGAALDTRAAFQPEIGQAILRPRMTGRLTAWAMTLVRMTAAEFALFEAFVHDDLRSGSLPFVFRVPGVGGPVARFQFATGGELYRRRYLPQGLVQVSFDLLQLPGKLWFAPYVPAGRPRVPAWVADYGANRFWIGQEQVTASGLSAISGTFLVFQQQVAFTQTFFTATYAGDVPQTAPLNVDWLAGFAP